MIDGGEAQQEVVTHGREPPPCFFLLAGRQNQNNNHGSLGITFQEKIRLSRNAMIRLLIINHLSCHLQSHVLRQLCLYSEEEEKTSMETTMSVL